MEQGQFQALAKLSGLKPRSKTYAACQSVFVGGEIAAQAARDSGIHASALSNSKNKIINVHGSIPERIAELHRAWGDGKL